MPDYPQSPIPSSVSAPAFIDPLLRFSVDQGYEVRRAKHSHPRRRYTLDYLGLATTNMRTLTDFLGTLRFGLTAFTWIHPTAEDPVTFANTTPIVLTYPGAHGLMTGQMVAVYTSPGNARNGLYVITRINTTQLTLNGSSAGGTGPGSTRVYLPNAVAIFPEDTAPSPTKLIGPEILTRGAWNVSLTIEEIF